MRELLRTGFGALLVLLIMLIGSLVMWIGAPLLWLWVGSQVQGATASPARGRDDPGHYVLEAVLVTSAAIALIAFVLWFFLFAGAEPLPLGLGG
jgi:hypothetical protein